MEIPQSGSGQEIREICISLARYVRQEEVNQRTLLKHDRAPWFTDEHAPRFNLRIANALPVNHQTLPGLARYRPHAWDDVRYEAIGTLVIASDRYVHLLPTSNIANCECDVAYQWRRNHEQPWSTVSAPELIKQFQQRSCHVYILGRPRLTAQSAPDLFTSHLTNWDTVNRTLDNRWYLSRPLHSYAIPIDKPGSFGGNHHAQLAQLTPQTDPVSTKLLELTKAFQHVNQHPTHLDARQSSTLSPPALSERVLVLDRSRAYESLLLESLYEKAEVPQRTRSLQDVFVAGGHHAYDTVLLNEHFGALMRELGVGIILLADVESLRTAPTADAALNIAMLREEAIQLVFLAQRAMVGAVYAYVEQQREADEAEDYMYWNYGAYHQAHPDGEEEAKSDKDDDSMDVEPQKDDIYPNFEQHAQDPEAEWLRQEAGDDHSSVDEEGRNFHPAPDPVQLPSPRRDDSSDSEKTVDM